MSDHGDAGLRQRTSGEGGRCDEQHQGQPRKLAILLVATFLAFVNYAALLSVVPMWASAGGATGVAVGATTGVMMAATVATQLAAPLVFRLLSLRTMMVAGSVILAAPTPLYILSSDLGWVLGITAVRGVGFALVVISGATLAADLARSGKLSSSASLYGTAAALPNLGALAGGVWIADAWGFATVFWVAGGACLVAAVLSMALPADARSSVVVPGLAQLRRIGKPVGLFLLTAASFGAATTFLPVAGPDAGQASSALLAASVALVVGRLGAGFLGDRLGPGRLVIASVIVAAGGLALISLGLDGPPASLLLGAAMLGAGFGACQNDSFVATVDRLGPGRTGTASTLWNMAYDGGIGLGAVALGWIIGLLGYGGAFLAMAGVIVGIGVIAQFFTPTTHPGRDR